MSSHYFKLHQLIEIVRLSDFCLSSRMKEMIYSISSILQSSKLIVSNKFLGIVYMLVIKLYFKKEMINTKFKIVITSKKRQENLDYYIYIVHTYIMYIQYMYNIHIVFTILSNKIKYFHCFIYCSHKTKTMVADTFETTFLQSHYQKKRFFPSSSRLKKKHLREGL